MIEKKVYQQLLRNGLTIAFAESMTGGSLTYEMIKNPGSSKVLKGSIVAYNNAQKVKLLNINQSEIDQYSVVSEQVSRSMATSIRNIMGTDIGVGITGNAGPKIQDHTKNLEAWISIDFQGKVSSYNFEFCGLTRLEAIKKNNPIYL